MGSITNTGGTRHDERPDELLEETTPWAGYMAIPDILSRFSEQHPNVHLEIHTLNSVQQLHAVKARVIDVAFMWRSSADDNLRIDGLLAHPLAVALSVRHRLAARTYLSPRDLQGESYVTLDPNVAPVYSHAVAEYWETAGGHAERAAQGGSAVRCD